MPASSSELRQLASCSPLSVTPSHAEISPAFKVVASTDPELESASKANNRSVSAGRGRRKVLADLSGNDSPIVGLIPGMLNCAARNVPTASCEFRSGLGVQNSTKKPVVPPSDRDSGNTPMGESLLRSQVKLLLRQVESDAPSIHRQAPSLRALCHLHTFLDSPALKLVAPTPINTPCSNISSYVHVPTATVHGRNNKMPFAQTSYQQEDQHRADIVEDSGIKLLVDLHISPEAEAVAPSERLSVYSKTSESGHITITESVLSGSDHHIMQLTPLISEAFDDQAHILALGKKLQFDSPDKLLSTDHMGVTSPESKEGLYCSSLRDLEEDEASEWSILGNVSSPDETGGHDVVEAELDAPEEDSADSSNSLHVDQRTPVWRCCRRATPFPKGVFKGDEYGADDEQSDGIEALEEYAGKSNHSEGEEACIKGQLPVAEGKHIRFSYDSDDEIQEIKGLS